MTQNARAVVAGPSPVRLTSFVGRVAELQRVGEELNRHRMISLVGPGGSGKTRLALEAAQAWAMGERWFVDLAPIEPDGVGSALAVATAAPEGPGEDPLDATVRRIGAETALLLLDNCDQLVESCAPVVDMLLRSCSGLVVLPTSREPLRVEGEHVWRVPARSLPSDGDTLDGDAVLLFSSAPACRLKTRYEMPSPSGRSAAISTACPLPSSSPHPGQARCRWATSSPASRISSAC